MIQPKKIHLHNDVNLIREVTYFNLEISPCKTTFVINASKKGIDCFLEKISLEPPYSRIISTKDLQRSQRRWLSWKLQDNEDVSDSDPTTYFAQINRDEFNAAMNEFYVEFISDSKEELLFSLGIREWIPVLTVNARGWQQFLDILQYLRDVSHWFYLTIPNPLFKTRLRFQLTPNCYSNSKDHIFKALECIRLEPEEETYLQTHADPVDVNQAKEREEKENTHLTHSFRLLPVDILGNSAGYLLFSQWISDFASSQDKSTDIHNPWEKFPHYCRKYLSHEAIIDDHFSSWLRLRKIEEKESCPIFLIGTIVDGSSDLYILGNPKGLIELSKILEKYSFYSDEDCEYNQKGPKNKKINFVDFPHFRSFSRLTLNGGALYNPIYGHLRMLDLTPVQKNFINSRVIL